jgi:hypothetical protein
VDRVNLERGLGRFRHSIRTYTSDWNTIRKSHEHASTGFEPGDYAGHSLLRGLKKLWVA